MRVRDLESDISHLESIPIVKNFSEDFPNNLHMSPQKWEIDISIDLLPQTKRISISHSECYSRSKDLKT